MIGRLEKTVIDPDSRALGGSYVKPTESAALARTECRTSVTLRDIRVLRAKCENRLIVRSWFSLPCMPQCV